MSSLWGELRRRKVVRATISYVIAAVGIGAAADVFLPGLGAPPWALATVLVLLLLGLPLVVALAWAYDVTPDGVSRTTSTADPPRDGTDVESGGSAPAPDGPSRAGTEAAGDAWIPDPQAIAVLPFANLSEDPANEYFSDGVTEDILTHLTEIADLHVISRTSVMTYKSSTASVGQIARELRVGSVLEGSVRKAGDRVRVTAQLIEARTDRHLWAQTYDRDLDDIFAVQSDVAKQIAKALQARLAPAVLSHINARPSEDMKAYELFVKGRQNLYSVRPERILQAVEQLEEAVALDRDFAPALAMLGLAQLFAAYWAGATPRDAFRRAKTAGEKAARLDERSALARTVVAGAKAHYDYDWTGATSDARHAVRLGPSDRDAHFWLGFVLVLQERFEEALPSYERALALDPHEPVMATHRALATWLLGGQAEAEQAFQRIATAHPTFADVYAIWAVGLGRDARWDDYAEVNRRGAEITGGHAIFRARQALGLRRAGRTAEAATLAEDVRSGAQGELPSNIRMILALAVDDQAGAELALDQAIEERQPMVLWHRLMGSLPREEPWVRERLARIFPEAPSGPAPPARGPRTDPSA